MRRGAAQCDVATSSRRAPPAAGTVPVMTRFGVVALAVVTLLVSSCSRMSTAPTGGVANPSTATTAPTMTTPPAVATTKAPNTALTGTVLAFSPKSAGEVARAIYVPHAHTGTLWRAPTKNSYVVRAACSASAPGATVTYEVLDARPSTPETERSFTSAEIPCDSTVTVNSASPLVGNVISIKLTNISDRVTRAFAVIVPE